MQGKPRPHETIPNTFGHFTRGWPPTGYREGPASPAELQAAGFHVGAAAEPTPPADELLASGWTAALGVDEARSILAGGTFLVLRDPSGAIVASWAEGRWWTPAEAAAFTAASSGDE
jgi:hypothetical protein